MSNRSCDLHTHSHFSDGTWSPTAIIEEAEAIGLSYVALTDHNNINGLDEFVNNRFEVNKVFKVTNGSVSEAS